MDRSIFDQYEAGGTKLRQAIAGLGREDLIARPPAAWNTGLWSIQHVVMHLMDSDLIWAARIKCMIAEEKPKILGYDESKFAANLLYDEQDTNLAVEVFDLNRKQFVKVLRKLPAAAFLRTGEHNERGTITVEESINGEVEHLEHHVKFILAKREKMGKETR